MKLNVKRTILVGLAFFSICAFWQAYDSVIPLILRDTFRLGDTVAGFVMSLDNILALLLLPVFGALSDKAGRRMPFIVGGTITAAVLTVALPSAVNSGNLVIFFAVLGVLLFVMSVYRSPAVALMPDVTEKPLRSKGNAVINLMGALGGIYTIIVIFIVDASEAGHGETYMPLFVAVAVIMLLSVAVLRCTIKEKALVQEMRACNYGMPKDVEDAKVKDDSGTASLPPEVKRSLVLILSSVALWFMGYNAITTAFTKYATAVWGHNLSQAANCLLIATAGALVSYIPIGMLATRIGRKKTILIGIALLSFSFAAGSLIVSDFSPILYGLFLIIGFAWASINVNSYPMVVEISRYGNVGKYTGYYYTFSMAAQIVTPILSGALLEHVGYYTLFPYAAVMVAASFVTMYLTKHGDNKPVKSASGLEAFDVDD